MVRETAASSVVVAVAATEVGIDRRCRWGSAFGAPPGGGCGSPGEDAAAAAVAAEDSRCCCSVASSGKTQS